MSILCLATSIKQMLIIEEGPRGPWPSPQTRPPPFGSSPLRPRPYPRLLGTPPRPLPGILGETPAPPPRDSGDTRAPLPGIPRTRAPLPAGDPEARRAQPAPCRFRENPRDPKRAPNADGSPGLCLRSSARRQLAQGGGPCGRRLGTRPVRTSPRPSALPRTPQTPLQSRGEGEPGQARARGGKTSRRAHHLSGLGFQPPLRKVPPQPAMCPVPWAKRKTRVLLSE